MFGKSKTPSFILTLSLPREKWQIDYLNKLFRVCGNISNDLIDDRRKALSQLERNREWKAVQAGIAALKKKGEKENIDEDVLNKMLKPLYDKRSVLLEQYGMDEAAFQTRMKKWSHHYKGLVHSQVAQKLASSVWKKFEAYFFRGGKSVDFIPWTTFASIEGKNNTTGIIYKDGFIILGKTKIKVKTPSEKGKSASDIYEREALSHRVKYCRIIRRWREDGWQYRVQLILEGTPPVKRKATGDCSHPRGKGRVGLDIGTQTLAYSSNSEVGLVELAPSVRSVDAELRRINRAMDRSRRGTNPQMFAADGTVVPVNKLPPECLDKRGRRIWQESKRYKELAIKRRAFYQKQKELRVQQHNELANKLLALGDDFYIEQMRFRGLGKKAKEAKKNNKGKWQRRKRFGKSIAMKAPATFVSILETKVIRSGGRFQKIKTWEAKASQYNHLDHTYNKKKLSQRWNKMPDGRRIQRDMYSAFLIQNANETLDGFDKALCDANYNNFVILHDKEIQRLKGAKMPSSAGI